MGIGRFVVLAAFVGVLLSACDGRSSLCRTHPSGCTNGEPGAFCDFDDECEDLCCRSGECGGGMCTFACRDDRDCPSDMGCEHDRCFYLCDDDFDCAVGQRCEHNRTVCEY